MRFQNSSSSRAQSAPATTSEWPFSTFVAACMTISAPSVSGRVWTGEAQVESTASLAPAACAISAVAWLKDVAAGRAVLPGVATVPAGGEGGVEFATGRRVFAGQAEEEEA